MTIEQEYHDALLKWCRSKPRGMGIPCMRVAHSLSPDADKGVYMVVDNSRFDAPVLARGHSWQEVLTRLGIPQWDLP